MAFLLFNSKPPLDEPSIQWQLAVFDWGLRNADARLFFDGTALITPTNDHYPGRENSVHGMASLIFERTAAYAGMAHWPFRLVEPLGAPPIAPPGIQLQGPLRLAPGTSASRRADGPKVPVTYDAQLLNDPEAMIAGFAQVLAHWLASAIDEAPPGGNENWPQMCEVLGVFLGFGLMFANTAFSFKPSACGSCAGPVTQRQVFLSQYDVTYALALFCALKKVPAKAVLRHLKSPLRPHFKRCLRDIENGDRLAGI